VLERRVAFEGHVWDVVSETIDLGADVIVHRDYLDHPGAVAIVAMRDSGEVLLLRQYRHPVGREIWEPPAGLLDSPIEEPLDAAKRELFEEADLEADTWHVLLDLLTSPGGSSEAIRIYLARDLREVPESQKFTREAEEKDMVPRWVTVQDALDAVIAGKIAGPTAVSGLFAVDAARRAKWRTLKPANADWDRP